LFEVDQMRHEKISVRILSDSLIFTE
jgi:hypothetical protein